MNRTVLMDRNSLELWLNVSIFLKWSVVCVGAGSVPILVKTLHKLFTIYRKSQYFVFLTAIIILDLIMLTTIFINAIVDSFPFSQGNLLCKYTAFVATATASHSNWLWLCMYAQRFLSVFYPFARVKSNGIWRFIDESRKLLVWTGIFSHISTVWLLFVMQDIEVNTPLGTGHFCGPDFNSISPPFYRFLEITEVATGYAIPFIITVFLDFSVIFNRYDNNKFTLVSSETMSKGFSSNEACVSFKIQSEESIKATNLKRRRNIRRCLLIVTCQGLLNLPFYILQIFYNKEEDLVNISPSYLVADAIFYLIFLSQFPLKALFVHLLHLEWRSVQTSATSTDSNSAGYRQIKFKNSTEA